MDFPGAVFNSPVISPYTLESLGPSTRALAGIGTPASAAWPAANRAIYVPFRMTSLYTVQRVWWINGATLGANVDCGIYTIGGTRLAVLGSTAQAGTNALQSASLSVSLWPGSYYMALLLSNNTGTVFRTVPSGAVHCALMGMAQQAVGATALPATATFATVATAYLPTFGITSRTVI